MRSRQSADRNLIFRVDRGRLIDPQTKSNLLIFDKESPRQNFSNIKTPVGTDQNIFFRIPKILQPTLNRRLIKDLDPVTRVIGRLSLTKKERLADRLVASTDGILKTLKDFMSEQELDNQGNVVLDPITNQPVIKLRSISDILKVAHTGLNEIFKQGGVVLSPVFNNILNSLTFNSSIIVAEQLKDLEKVNPDMDQPERDALYKDILMKERINKDDEIKLNTPIEQVVEDGIIEQKHNNGEWRGLYPRQFIKPADWQGMNTITRGDLKQYITTRARLFPGTNFQTALGTSIGIATRGMIMGSEFGRGNFLDLDSLEFLAERDVPREERIVLR